MDEAAEEFYHTKKEKEKDDDFDMNPVSWTK